MTEGQGCSTSSSVLPPLISFLDEAAQNAFQEAISAYQNQWATQAAQGVEVRIVGPCVSACTVLVGYVPRRNICVMPNAYLGFHWATTAFHTQELWSAYPPDIRVISASSSLGYEAKIAGSASSVRQRKASRGSESNSGCGWVLMLANLEQRPSVPILTRASTTKQIVPGGHAGLT
jgi:hypothetical protein